MELPVSWKGLSVWTRGATLQRQATLDALTPKLKKHTVEWSLAIRLHLDSIPIVIPRSDFMRVVERARSGWPGMSESVDAWP